jgi:hypothetical protein
MKTVERGDCQCLAARATHAPLAARKIRMSGTHILGTITGASACLRFMFFEEVACAKLVRNARPASASDSLRGPRESDLWQLARGRAAATATT